MAGLLETVRTGWSHIHWAWQTFILGGLIPSCLALVILSLSHIPKVDWIAIFNLPIIFYPYLIADWIHLTGHSNASELIFSVLMTLLFWGGLVLGIRALLRWTDGLDHWQKVLVRVLMYIALVLLVVFTLVMMAFGITGAAS